jgi:O-antigen ligase
LSANAILYRLLLLVIILSPLPLGSARPLAWTGLAVCIGGLLAAWSLLLALGRVQASLSFSQIGVPVLLFLPALAWPLVQIMPLDPAGMTQPLWQETATLLGHGRGHFIALDPGRAATALMLWITNAGIFLLAAQLSRHRPREGLAALAWAGVAYAVYGLGLHMLGIEKILWMDKWAYLGTVTSTFVNRNAYAAYAGIGMICCMALLIDTLRVRAGRLREMAETMLVRSAPYALAILILGMALALTQSRAALGATIAGLIMLWACLLAAGVMRQRSALICMGGLISMTVLVISLGGEGTLNRIAEAGMRDETRDILNRITWTAFLDAPLIGHGLGSYPSLLTIYRDAGLSQPETFQHAHNLHLEILVEIGAPATLALYAAVGSVLYICLAGLRRRRRDQIYPAVALAAATLLVLHGLVDFSLQMPAIAATFAFLLGLGVSQSFPSGSTARPDDD